MEVPGVGLKKENESRDSFSSKKNGNYRYELYLSDNS